MLTLFCFVLSVLASPFKSKCRLEAENVVLRHQLIILQRKVRRRGTLTNNDRWFLVQLYRWFPPILQVDTIIQPETIVRWHRAGFRSDWRWKSRPRGGRPRIEADLRALIRRMSIESPLWGAPRTMKSERIGHCTKMRQFLARFSVPESSGLTRFSAGFITTTFGFRFSVHTPSRERSETRWKHRRS
jgi:hypothetical protein